MIGLQVRRLLRVEPVVAMLDGLPLEHHVALADRLLIDDPDGFSSRYQATIRCMERAWPR